MNRYFGLSLGAVFVVAGLTHRVVAREALTALGVLEPPQTALTETLPSAPDPGETGQTGLIAATIGYAQDEGASVALDGVVAPGGRDDHQLSFGLKLGERGALANATYRIKDGLPAWGDLFFGVNALTGRPTAAHDFRYAAATAVVGVVITRPLARTTAYAGLGFDDLTDPGPRFPAVAAGDLGDRRKVVFGLEHAMAGETATGSWSVDLGTELAALTKGGSIARFRFGGALTGAAAGGKLVWSADLRAGAVTAQGTTTSIGDRFFLGGTTLRGFGFGGFGPYDPVAQAPVGGTQFAALRLDLRAPEMFGQDARLIPGVHYDVGALWGLDVPSGLDTGAHARQTVGVTLLYEIGEAAIEVSLSKALNPQATDRTEEVQFQLRHKF